ncbi:MAG TPA: ABC-F family ATP-binding cassette domain-containing protein, partial [Longimicrobiales bacterium]|nr:ABC-F family ATP-binding cassette domain-containing protein [Longimicrobiales bacterium]
SQIVVMDVAVEFAGTAIFERANFTVSRGSRWGVIGRNGSGKTTLLRVAAGQLAPTRGSVSRASGLRIIMVDQHRELGAELSVWDAAAAPFDELRALERSLEEQAKQLAQSATPAELARYDHDLERFAREGGYGYAARVDAVLHGLGFDPGHAHTQQFGQLSGGEQGRIALARQLVAPADLLLLDEPTNHLDLETTGWLEQYLRNLDASALIISHDRAFLDNVVDHVLHIEAGVVTAYNASYRGFVHQHAEQRLTHARAYDAQQRTIAAEEDYIRRNLAGQNSRQAKGRRTRLARLERLSPPPTEQSAMAVRFANPERGGDQVLVARDARIMVGTRTLIDGLTARVSRGEVVGLIGANGTGKSTLLDAIAGLKPIAAGELRVGASVVPAYYRQDLTQVPLDKSLFDIIHDLRPRWERGQVQGHLGRFGFSGETVQRTANDLSGGERARVALAILVLARANFMLLDEPTNHLDVESIEALEDALDLFEGTVLLVSHDRALLRNLVTRVWSLRDLHITDYPGTFAEWERWEAERAAEANRNARAEAAANAELTRRSAQRRRESEVEQRARRRALQAAAAEAEAAVHQLESRIAQLKTLLEDPALYASADGARRANTLKAELDDADEALVIALERWTNAADALTAVQ